MSTMTINQIQDQIIEEFSLFPDWTEKYEYLLELGEQLPVIDAAYKTDEHIISGCQSQAWLQTEMVGDKIVFKADCDALIGKGIMALLIKVLSGHSAEDILQADLYFLDKIGLQEHLSMSRASGLESMISKLRADVAAIDHDQAG